jgi:hypothetical protein
MINHALDLLERDRTGALRSESGACPSGLLAHLQKTKGPVHGRD